MPDAAQDAPREAPVDTPPDTPPDAISKFRILVSGDMVVDHQFYQGERLSPTEPALTAAGRRSRSGRVLPGPDGIDNACGCELEWWDLAGIEGAMQHSMTQGWPPC